VGEFVRLGWPLAAVAALVAANALFVASEFAIVASPPLAIRRRAREGSRAARLVEWVQSDGYRQDRFIATSQLGITATTLGLGMVGESILAEEIAALVGRSDLLARIVSHGIAVAIAIAGLTFVHIVCGEMMPKSIALQKPQETALVVGPIMRVVQLALYPIVVFTNALSNALLRLLGIDRGHRGHEHLHTTEDLAWIVRESQERGVLSDEPAEVLRELLDFGDLTAFEVMVPRVQVLGLPLGAGPDEIRELLKDESHTRYPVYEETIDHVIGMVHIKDLMRLLPTGDRLDRRHVRELPIVPESMELDRLVGLMRAKRSQMAIVMDEHGGTAGLITLEDLFEEVVGEITEDPTEKREIEEVQGQLHLAGTTRLEEAGEELDCDLEHEDVDTVSGLVLHELGRPAEVGDSIEWKGLRFEVVAVAGHGVEDCVVTRLGPPADENGGEPTEGGDEGSGRED